MIGKGKLLFIIIMTIFFFGSSFSYTVAQENKKVILILINQLSFTDKEIYQQISGFKELEGTAAKGALNINSAATRSDANSYLTIGAGSKAVGIRELGNSYNSDEEVSKLIPGEQARDVYKQQTGITISPQSIIFLAMDKLQNEAIQKFPFLNGALGRTLESANAKAVVFGNNDTNQKQRFGPLITMNANGISKGEIGTKTLIKDNYRPFGVKANYDFFLEQLDYELGKREKALIVFDLGDLYRLEQFQKEMNLNYEAKIREVIFQEMGQFILQVMHRLEENEVLVVASPMISSVADKEGQLLAPIWVYQKKQQQGDLLYSNTTKREGIVANIDIAPSILSYLNIGNKPSEMLGQTMTAISSTTNLEDELEHISTIYKLRQKVLYAYVMWQVFILLFAAIAWLSKWRKIYIFIQIGLLSMLFSPLLFLLTAYWTPTNSQLYVFVLTILSLLIAFMLHKLKSIPKIFFIAGLLTFLLITIDIFNGTPLMKRSFLGYDPIIGARYYGIGNEFMGVFVGATFLFTGALIFIRKSWVTLTFVGGVYLLLNIILITPTLGTNAGGAISAMAATSFIILRFSGLSFQKRGLIYLITLIFIGFIALIAINYFAPAESQSHIGRAINQLFTGDISSIFQTIQRKLAMNWKLVQVSSWSKVLASAILATVILFLKPVQPLKRFLREYAHLSDGFLGILVGGLTALLVNDSGIVAAATMIIFMAIPLLYIGFDKKIKELD